MLINEYLKSYEFSEYHEILISQGPQAIFPLIKTIRFKKSKIIHGLFLIRRLPPKMDTLTGFLESGFILLGEKKNEEILVGFILSVRGIQVVSPLEFKEFNETKSIKGVWNFRLTGRGHETLLSTETRVHCPGKTTRIFFLFYWLLISYFSGIIRKEILRLIKEEAESSFVVQIPKGSRWDR